MTSVLGFVYWWVAARQFPPEAVGIASATISTMALLGSLCMLGLGTLLITELPRQPDQEGSLISTALVVVGGVGGAGMLFAIISLYVSVQSNPLKAGIADSLVFAVGVSLTAVTLVLDQALIGILRGNLPPQVPTLILPVLVTVLLSAEVNAWFYVSWMIANFLFVVTSSLTSVLHAMSSAQQSSLRHQTRVTLELAFGTSLLTNGVLQLATKQVLGVFGSSYAEQAAWCLRILVFAAFPLIIKIHYISFCRIHDRVTNAMLGI